MRDIRISQDVTMMWKDALEFQQGPTAADRSSSLYTFSQLVIENLSIAERVWSQRVRNRKLIDETLKLSPSLSLEELSEFFRTTGQAPDSEVTQFRDAFIALNVLQTLYVASYRENYHRSLHPQPQPSRQPPAVPPTHATDSGDWRYIPYLNQAFGALQAQLEQVTQYFQILEKQIGTEENAQQRFAASLENGLMDIYTETWTTKRTLNDVLHEPSTSRQAIEISKCLERIQQSTKSFLAQLDIQEVNIEEGVTPAHDTWTSDGDEYTERKDRHNIVYLVERPGFERMSSRAIVRSPHIIRFVHKR